MPDVLVNSDVFSPLASAPRVYVSPAGAIYYFFIRVTNQELVYVRSADRGATWAAPVVIFAAETAVAFAIWSDEWNITGGLAVETVHVSMLTASTLRYRSLDTSTDTLGTAVDVRTGLTVTQQSWMLGVSSGGPNIYIQWRGDDAAEHDLERSTDGGATWATRTASFQEDGTQGDDAFLYPSADGPTVNINAIFLDQSPGAMSRKAYVDSSDTIAETAFGNSVVAPGSSQIVDIAIRRSDGATLVAFHRDRGPAHDMEFFEIASGGGITQRTNVITATADAMLAAVLVDPNTDRIYVAYARYTTFASDGTLFYRTSDDLGVTWSAETQITAGTTRALRIIASPVSVRPGGFFAPIFIDADGGSPFSAFINTDNRVDFPVQPAGGRSQGIARLLLLEV